MIEVPANLFRQEALEFQRDFRQWGEVAALEPLSIKITAWFITALVAGLLTFLFLVQYARKETAVGYLTPTKGTAKIFVAKRGTIKEVLVAEGESVREGQQLLTIETDQIASDGMDVNATQLETLGLQRHLLVTNIKAEEQRGGSERDRLTAAARGLETEIVQIQEQIKFQTERLHAAEADLSGEALVVCEALLEQRVRELIEIRVGFGR